MRQRPTKGPAPIAIDDTKIEELLERADRGEGSAIGRLREYNRRRLRRVVAARFDRRWAARIDLSVVVLEALLEAEGGLPDTIRDRPVSVPICLCKIKTRSVPAQ
jgi:hypothetical protein